MEQYENTLRDVPIPPHLKKYNIVKHIQSKTKPATPEITYDNYMANRINLAKCKLPELKSAAKRCKLHISGKKELVIERIKTYYNNTKNAIKLQTTFRRWLAIQMMRLRGPALKSRSECVNGTDFSTLEPIDEIPVSKFYSYADANNKVMYGFDITSLIELMRQNTTFQNPYNRELFNSKIRNDILTLYRTSFILVPNFKSENQPYRAAFPDNQSRIQRDRNARIAMRAYHPRINPIMSENLFNQYDNITQRRTQPISTRIAQLFIAIDRLGNYTNGDWFASLDLRSYIRLYRYLYDIWYVRSGLSYETRSLICPYSCPFEGIFTGRTLYSELTYPQIQTACVIVFENLVYSGVSEEYKTLGAFYAMSALTLVSPDARHSMPWLYEAVM
jgi:hypothetical protein